MANLLKIQNLSLKITDKLIYQDLNFSLQKGDCIGILGNNGAGKTTLLQTIAGLRKSTQSVFLSDQPIEQLSFKSRAKKLGIFLQNQDFNQNNTVFDMALNSRFAHHNFFNNYKKTDENIITEQLKKFGLSDKKSQSVATLSGGEKQRLALAMLSGQMPDIYLLDEPFNNLDLKNHQLVVDEFGKKSGKSSIIVLHNLYIAQKICSHFLLLKQGQWRFGKIAKINQLDNLKWLYEAKIEAVQINGQNFYVPVVE